MSLIYGSTALKYWCPDLPREPKDLDLISDVVTPNHKGVEYFWTKAFHWLKDHNGPYRMVTLDNLYTIKVSHCHWDVNWTKHIFDVGFMKEHGAALNKEFYNLLVEDWGEIHGSKNHISLNKRNKDFFNKNVTREWDHDELHEYLSFYKTPMHNLIRKDPDSPLCSEEMFNCLTKQDQLYTALEEMYVIATERYILPKKVAPMAAKANSYKDLVVRISKGWFSRFLIENTYELMKYSKEEDELWKSRLLKMQEKS